SRATAARRGRRAAEPEMAPDEPLAGGRIRRRVSRRQRAPRRGRREQADVAVGERRDVGNGGNVGDVADFSGVGSGGVGHLADFTGRVPGR
ncbi:hypothetical protein, partial [Burkholderia pseudomallei]|uniref:hypothetical protein n=1 Tax=Burkholderia pseudomallei TaxID=28450 RepID=UPI001CA4D77E